MMAGIKTAGHRNVSVLIWGAGAVDLLSSLAMASRALCSLDPLHLRCYVMLCAVLVAAGACPAGAVPTGDG